MLKFKGIYCLIILSLFAYVISDAQDTTAGLKTLKFEEVLNEGFQNNYKIKLQNISLKKATFGTMHTKGYLDPYFSFEAVKGSGIDPTITNKWTNYFQTEFVFPTLIGIDFYSGGRVESSNLIAENFIMNSSGAWVGTNVPLLRGLGKNNTINAAIRSSLISEQASEMQLSNEVMAYFRDLLIAYLSLKKNTVQYTIQAEALAEAEKYRNAINELIDKGELPRVEKNRSDAFVSQQQQEQNNVKLNVLNANFDMKLLLGVKENNLANEMPVVSELIPDPDFDGLRKFIVDHQNLSDSVVMNTPVYKNIALLTDATKVQLDAAKNQKLNQFDLDIRLAQFGMYTNGDYNFSKTLKSNYPGSSILLSLKYTLPLKNQQQKGAYLIQQAEFEATKTSLEQSLFEIKTQAQRALINLEQLLALYSDNKFLVGIRNQTYANEKEKFKMGNSTQLDVILSFEKYFESTVSHNNLKFDIYNTIVHIKYLLGELPANERELEDFSLEGFTRF
jgi:outer membrane protein TolC